MNSTQKILFAKNELENVIGALQKQLEMSEDDMMIVLELLLSTTRYRTIVKGAYDQIELVKQNQNKNQVKVEKINTEKEGEN